jgi:carboxypeptidase C (cathepsin A)
MRSTQSGPLVVSRNPSQTTAVCYLLPANRYLPSSYILERMKVSALRLPSAAFVAFALTAFLSCSSLPAHAQSDDSPHHRGSASSDQAAPAAAPDKAAKPGDKDAEKDADKLPPLPPDAHTEQSITLDGRKLTYTVTVGTLPVRNEDGKTVGNLVFTAYTVDGANRPVTFAVNGGPGASSVYLNFGAIGPKHLSGVGNEGDSPSDPATLSDNPGTWLDFTDLVFIDPIGTGFSRSLVSADESRKLFYSTEPDIEYLSRAIYDWLVKNDRLQSRKYLVGESYGGFRGPRITYYLQSQLGVAMNGVVLVSPYLNPTINTNGDLSPLPWLVTLPSITAANLERQGKLTPEAMQPVISYTLGDYLTTLVHGQADQAATDAMIKKVTDMTGLDPTFVKESGGRLETGAYLREVHREQGKLGSVYDSNVTSFDPFPYAAQQQANDPILASIIAPSTTAMVDFVTRVVGWKVDARYNALSYDVAEHWDREGARSGSATQLRQAVAADPKLRVMIVHGWNDLSCPFMGSILTVNQMPVMGDPSRVSVHEFPGGHMFYTRESSRIALRKDVQEMVSLH